MIDYLKRIVNEYTKGKPCALMLDSYGAHITDKVYTIAKKYNIELIVVPCCMTSTLAPLDVGKKSYPIFCSSLFLLIHLLSFFCLHFLLFSVVGINGVIKSIYSKHWRMIRLFEDHEQEKTLPWADAVQEAHHAYHKLTSHTIKSSFNKAVQFPPSSSLSLLDLIKNEENIKKQIEIKERQDNPPPLPSRSSDRISSILADPCIDDAIIARSLVEDFD